MAWEIVTWQMMKDFFVSSIDGLNSMYQGCIDMFEISPYNLTGISGGNPYSAAAGLQNIIDVVTGVVSGVALSLCILFFMMEFFKKSMDLQWVKWENVLMLMLKLIFAKVIVENSTEIMMFIFDAFSGLATSVNNQLTAVTGVQGFMPVRSLDEDPMATDYAFFFLTTEEYQYYYSDGGVFGLARWLKMIELQPSIWIAQIIMLITGIIIFARVFEIMVYTMISPIPLASFSSEEHRQIGISFIKSFAAVCLQALVIIVMFFAFSALGTQLNALQGTYASGSWGILLRVLTLGIGVFKSGSWAKKMCGAM